jgi:hypothetical protein
MVPVLVSRQPGDAASTPFDSVAYSNMLCCTRMLSQLSQACNTQGRCMAVTGDGTAVPQFRVQSMRAVHAPTPALSLVTNPVLWE